MRDISAQLKEIKPGENYPSFVEITEEIDGKTETVKFCLRSYFVGMYCAIYFPGERIPAQCGDHDNKKFVRGLKKDIQKALDRGAKVEIGALWPVKKDMA